MFCVNCGSKLDDDAVFCTNCGKKITDIISKEEIKYCTNCGNKLDKDSVFCTNCGKKIELSAICSVGTTAESSKIVATQEKPENETPKIAVSEKSSEDKTKKLRETKIQETVSETMSESSKTEKNAEVDSPEPKVSASENLTNNHKIEEKTQNESDGNVGITVNPATLLSLREYNCLSTEDKNSYKVKLDALLVDERIDAETKRNICKTLIQYGYIYYSFSKYMTEVNNIENRQTPATYAKNTIESEESTKFLKYNDVYHNGKHFVYLEDSSKLFCPKCKKRVDINSTICQHCNASFYDSLDSTKHMTNVNNNGNKSNSSVVSRNKIATENKESSTSINIIIFIVLILSVILMYCIGTKM